MGLFGTGTGTAPEYGSHVTPGQVIGVRHQNGDEFDQGGACHIFAAAGTYDVSVQFKSSSPPCRSRPQAVGLDGGIRLIASPASSTGRTAIGGMLL
jgi:hypothetical protein